MPAESMKELIESSIKSGGLSETEIAEWVTNLKSYHDEEVRRQALRFDEFDEVHRQHSQAVDNFEATVQQLDKTLATLRQESATLARERDELRQVKQDLQRERQLLAETVSKLEPDASVYLGVGVAAALFALFLLTLLQWLGPVVARWVGGVFG